MNISRIFFRTRNGTISTALLNIAMTTAAAIIISFIIKAQWNSIITGIGITNAAFLIILVTISILQNIIPSIIFLIRPDILQRKWPKIILTILPNILMFLVLIMGFVNDARNWRAWLVVGLLLLFTVSIKYFFVINKDNRKESK